MLIGLGERTDGIEDVHQGLPYGDAWGKTPSSFHSLSQDHFELLTKNLACQLVMVKGVY